MILGTIIYTWIYGNFVGSDEYGNKYYCNSKKFNNPDSKRWIMFKGDIEASKIPPHWHSWLHKTTNDPPIKYKHKYSWQKDHEENFTGTKKAFSPVSSSKSNEVVNNKSKEYVKWRP